MPAANPRLVQMWTNPTLRVSRLWPPLPRISRKLRFRSSKRMVRSKSSGIAALNCFLMSESFLKLQLNEELADQICGQACKEGRNQSLLRISRSEDWNSAAGCRSWHHDIDLESRVAIQASSTAVRQEWISLTRHTVLLLLLCLVPPNQDSPNSSKFQSYGKMELTQWETNHNDSVFGPKVYKKSGQVLPVQENIR